MPVEVRKAQAGPRPLRALVYGASGRWKTTFAATMPSPVFISVAHEEGDRTLQVMFPHVDVIEIAGPKDMEEALKIVRTQHHIRGWQTVVIDSLSFYVEAFIADRVAKKQQTNQQDWLLLELHILKNLVPDLHSLPLHICWICLEQQVKDDATGTVLRIEPMLPGKTAIKFPACCELRLYADQVTVRRPDNGLLETSIILRTQPHGPAIAGGRFGNAFPEGYVPPHFAYIAQRIGSWIGVDPAAYGLTAVPPSGSGEPAQPATAAAGA